MRTQVVRQGTKRQADEIRAVVEFEQEEKQRAGEEQRHVKRTTAGLAAETRWRPGDELLVKNLRRLRNISAS